MVSLMARGKSGYLLRSLVRENSVLCPQIHSQIHSLRKVKALEKAQKVTMHAISVAMSIGIRGIETLSKMSASPLRRPGTLAENHRIASSNRARGVAMV